MASEITVKTKKRLLPLIITISIALGLSFLGIISGFFTFSTAFIPEGQGGFDPLIGLFNALILIVIAIFGAFMIYLLLKYKKENIIRYFFFVSFIIIGGFMLFLFGISILYMFYVFDIVYYIIMTILSFSIGILLTFMIFYKKLSNNILIKNTGLMIFGALIGAFLGLVLPTWTSFLLLIGLSIYDVFAVFKGPIKKILELEEKNNQNFLEIRNEIRNYEIGLGDLTFYSMLVCATLKIGFDTQFIRIWGPIAIFLPCLVSIIGILLGALITFKLLEKKEMLPGLPISILLGIGLFGLVLLVFWVI
ncbi:MAG: hypothetical protein EU551_03885 [Promethearchaeota archaeon]|nr:MAG: hypothetical protein EU551_03885 [Candidatus Lokiarchaeota archaeon]